MTDDKATATIEEPMPPTPDRPPLTRPADDRVLAGVASGIARHFGWDPLLVRLGFILACFVGGAGFFAYVAGWIMMPRDTDADARDYRSPSDLQRRGLAFWIGVGLLALGALSLFGGNGFFDAGFVVAVALVAVGVAIWKSGDRAGDSTWPSAQANPAVGHPIDGPVAVTTSSDPTEALAMPPAPPTAPGGPNPAFTPVAPSPKRPRSYLGRVTFGLALLATAVTVALERSNTLDLTMVQVLGVPLVVLAGGILVGTVVGRARWLIVPALILTLTLPVVAFVTELDVDISSGIGERNIIVRGASDEGEHRLGIGQLVLDLGTALDDEPDLDRLELEASLGLGELVIRLPDDPDVGYSIVATVRNGEIHVVGGESITGRHVTRTFRRPARDGAGTIIVEATVGAGSIEIIE